MPHVSYAFFCKFLPALLLAGLAGCAGINVASVDRAPLREAQASIKENLLECHARFGALDSAARSLGVVDARHQRVEGLPHLRTSRFLASFDAGTLSDTAYQRWLMHLNDKAVEGLLMEWQRLPRGSQEQLSLYLPGEAAAVERTLSDCGAALVAHQAGLPRMTGVTPVDQYQNWKRWAGLYPLAAVPFYLGVVTEHRSLQQQQGEFASIGADRAGPWTHFEPPVARPPTAEALALLREQALDELGIPLLSTAAAERLLAAFMPALAMQHDAGGLADNDRPARLIANSAGAIVRDITQPTVYTHISHGRYRDQVTLQLNYSFWFTERKPGRALDLLAGEYDGITWRVHLSPSGAVLGYDKMHQCGCWYQFFPASGFSARPTLPITQEPFNIGPALEPDQHHSLWLESNTHHLLGVQAAQVTHSVIPLMARPYAELRALASPNGNHYSPFDAQGLVQQSRRPERFVFWPMGIASPGAMRIHGTHAMAFIGHRHFDDPWLLDELGLAQQLKGHAGGNQGGLPLVGSD